MNIALDFKTVNSNSVSQSVTTRFHSAHPSVNDNHQFACPSFATVNRDRHPRGAYMNVNQLAWHFSRLPIRSVTLHKPLNNICRTRCISLRCTVRIGGGISFFRPCCPSVWLSSVREWGKKEENLCFLCDDSVWRWRTAEKFSLSKVWLVGSPLFSVFFWWLLGIFGWCKFFGVYLEGDSVVKGVFSKGIYCGSVGFWCDLSEIFYVDLLNSSGTSAVAKNWVSTIDFSCVLT